MLSGAQYIPLELSVVSGVHGCYANDNRKLSKLLSLTSLIFPQHYWLLMEMESDYYNQYLLRCYECCLNIIKSV